MKKFIPAINITKDNLYHIIKYSLITATILIVIFSVGFFLYQNRQMISTALIAKPETFTELYFENHTQLPTKIVQKNTTSIKKTTNVSYSFSFTIHNLENKDMDYPYEVYLFDSKKIIVDHRKVFIKNNETKTINETFSLPNLYPRTEIVVNLIDKNQQIDFWMEEKLK